MTCNASDLVNAAKCYCFQKGMAGAIQTWLLCKWAQIEIENPPPPCEFAIALDGPGRVILSWGNPVVYDLIEVWHAPLFGPRHLETTLLGTDTSWTTPILAPGDFFIIRGKIGDDYSGFATGDTCPPPPPPLFSYAPSTSLLGWHDSGGFKGPSDLATFYATADQATVDSLDFTGSPNTITSIVGLSSLPLLSTADISQQELVSLDFSGCSNLVSLDFSANWFLTSVIGLSGLLNLQTVLCSSCLTLPSLNVSGCTALQTLNCSQCSLGTLNITGDFAITTLDFSSNPAVVIIGP